MASYNKVILMGNLTCDVELKYTPSGTAQARFSLASNRKFKDAKTNELREEVMFVGVEVWGKQAEAANQYLTKGRPVLIEGRLKFDQWDDKQTGQKRSKHYVVAERVQFLGDGKGRAASAPTPAASNASGPADDLAIDESSVPF